MREFMNGLEPGTPSPIRSESHDDGCSSSISARMSLRTTVFPVAAPSTPPYSKPREGTHATACTGKRRKCDGEEGLVRKKIRLEIPEHVVGFEAEECHSEALIVKVGRYSLRCTDARVQSEAATQKRSITCLQPDMSVKPSSKFQEGA